MKDYIIAIASTADIEADWLKEHDVPFISYPFTIGDKGYLDDCTDATKQILVQKMREGAMPSTSQISEYAYEEFFRGLLKTGKDLIFTDMSRAMSVSIRNAEEAMKTVAAEFPDQKTYFLDSYCITGGLSFLVHYLVKMKEDGASFDEVVSWGEAHKMHVMHRFTCNDLLWLRKGGRLSNASAVLGTILAVKPLMIVDDEGKLVAYEKVRGRKKSLLRMIDTMEHDIDPAGDSVMVYHCDCPDEAQFVLDHVQEKYPFLKNGSIHSEGPVIGAHVGIGFISIHYFGHDRVF